MKVDATLLFFFLANISASLLQIFVFSFLLLCDASKMKRLLVHVVMHSITLAILITGCYFYAQRKLHFEVNIQNDDEMESKIAIPYKQLMKQTRFTLSLMLWFRFMEWAMCACMYVSAFVSTLLEPEEYEEVNAAESARSGITHQAVKKAKKKQLAEDIEKFV